MRGTWGKRARAAVVATLVGAAVGLDGGGAAQAQAQDSTGVPDLPHPNAHGLRLEGTRLVDPNAGPDVSRMVDITVATDEIFEPRGRDGQDLDRPVTVRVWLPPGYNPERRRPYPVLYLLHGGGGGYWQWTTPDPPVFIDGKAVLDHAMDPDPTDVTPGTAFNGIVVMPEAGWVGWYTNWRGGTQAGFAPNWETFHIDQLVPWIDANFNTKGRRSGRAVAGVSMGGIGALMYATRHTDVFSAVGSFSAVPDLTEPVLHQVVSDNASGFPGSGASFGFDGLDDPGYWLTDPAPPDVEGRFQAIFGRPGARGDWPQRNPLRRAFTYNAYDGKFGLYSGQTTPTFEGESVFGETNQAFHHALDAAHVDHRYCSGPGRHEGPYFLNDLADFLNYVYGTPWTQCTTNADWVRDWEPAP